MTAWVIRAFAHSRIRSFFLTSSSNKRRIAPSAKVFAVRIPLEYQEKLLSYPQKDPVKTKILLATINREKASGF